MDLASSYPLRTLYDFWRDIKALSHRSDPAGPVLAAPNPDLSAAPDKETPGVNGTKDREIAPESIQFGRAFPCILQTICEVDPEEGLVQVSKIDVTDAYHRGTLKPSQVGSFAYVVPLVPEDDAILICNDLVLPI